jgi:hypothetical protein
MHLGLGMKPALCAPNITQGSPAALLQRQMAPRVWLLISSGSKKKEPRCAGLSRAKTSHWKWMWAEVSSSAPHSLHNGLSVNLISWRCLHRVLCPVRSPVTTLDCTLLKNKNLTLVPRLKSFGMWQCVVEQIVFPISKYHGTLRVKWSKKTDGPWRFFTTMGTTHPITKHYTPQHKFYVCGSIHLGNVYVQVQVDVLCILYFFLDVSSKCFRC